MATDDAEIVGAELLTKTGSGGLFRSGYLAERPIDSYLESHEQPRVVFATDGAGIRRENEDGQTSYEPGSGYRTLVALTTHRVVLVVGGGAEDGGDQPIEIELTAIDHVAAATDSRRSTVRLWVGDHVWELSPETTDVDTIETYLSAASQTRIRFERLLGEARDAIVEAARCERTGRLEDASVALERAAAHLQDASDAVSSFPAGAPDMHDRLAAYRDRHRTQQRRLLLARVEQIREHAREMWLNEDYEVAADRYHRAREVCESVLDREDLPPEMASAVRQTHAAIERDIDRLRVAPLQVAAARRRAAEDASLPGEAADRWRRAYEGYRTVLELDWGRPDPRFAGDSEAIETRLVAVASSLLDARSRAAELHRRAAIRFTRVGATACARESYLEARDHLEAATAAARELDPDAADGFRERLGVLADRIDCVSEADAVSRRSTDRGPPGSSRAWTSAVGPTSGTESVGMLPLGTDQQLPALGRQPSDGEATLARSGPAIDRSTSLSVYRSGSERDRTPAVHRSVHQPLEWYVRAVGRLDEAALLETVGVIWRELGWRVDRTTAGTGELLATRPGVETSLVLSVRRRGDVVSPSVLDVIVSSRDRLEGDPWPVFVTTDPVAPAAFAAAPAMGVTIIDSQRLAELWSQVDDRTDHRKRGGRAPGPS